MPAPCIIFGATGGIGSALARRLHDDGRPLFLTARHEDKLARLASAIGAPSAACNVMEPDAIEVVITRAAADGALSGLAYCVGSIVVRPLRASTAEDMLEAFRLNAVGAAMALKAAEPALAAGGGSVVLFSTVAVQHGFASHAVIAAAKGAVEGLTRALAAELAPRIRVNAVAPSLTRTPLAEPLTRNEAMAKGIAKLHPLPRLGEPDDIAAMAAFLLGPESGWITGQVLAVDGGRSRIAAMR